MTDAALGLSLQGAAASACASAGLALLSPHPRAAVRAIGATALAMALWAGLWHGLSPLAGGLITRFAADWVHWLSVAAVNGAVATLAWLPPWLILRSLRWRAPRRHLAESLAALALFLGLLLPWIGQEGAWPPESIVLALWCATLALLMGWRRAKQGHAYGVLPS